MSKNIFNKTLIIGLGLIGGSFAKALRKHNLSLEIFACDLDEESLQAAKDQNVINGEILLSNDLSSFDFIVIATPLSSYKEIFSQIAKTVSKGAVVIDLGSLKNLVSGTIPQSLIDNFIGCHPIAGSQENGFDASDANLFAKRNFVICSKAEKSKLITDLVLEIGAKPIFMEAKQHDEIYALVSHLPQFISFLTKEVSIQNIKEEFFKNAFRLNESAPEIWDDIFKLNQNSLEKFYINFFENLADIMEELDENGDVKFLISVDVKECPKFDEEFFNKNFAEIFFRAIIALSYLKIPQVKTYQEFAGKGFIDFISIVEILNIDSKKLQNLFEKNRAKIFKLFDLIS